MCFYVLKTVTTVCTSVYGIIIVNVKLQVKKCEFLKVFFFSWFPLCFNWSRDIFFFCVYWWFQLRMAFDILYRVVKRFEYHENIKVCCLEGLNFTYRFFNCMILQNFIEYLLLCWESLGNIFSLCKNANHFENYGISIKQNNKIYEIPISLVNSSNYRQNLPIFVYINQTYSNVTHFLVRVEKKIAM